LQRDDLKPRHLSEGIKCLKDVSAYGGALMTASAPNSHGGGAINMGHGWEYYTDPPRINMTDDGYHTLCITAGPTYDYENETYIGVDQVLADVKLRNLYWSSGAYLTDNQCGSIELGKSESYSSSPFIDFHFGRGVTEDFNVRLINLSDCELFFDTRTTTGGILPTKASAYVLGSSTYYWSYVYATYLRYHNNYAQFDAYDDLALVKLWGEKNPTIPDDYDPKKTKPSSGDPFEMLRGKTPDGKVDKDFFDTESVLSFSLGCLKASAKKHDEHDLLIFQMQAEIEDLRSQVTSLNSRN
jgi:hypothetical protein